MPLPNIVQDMFLLILISYLIGSVPSGYWFAKIFFGIDVTKHGSGNIGATNVARVLKNKKYFFLIFFFDFVKSFLTLFVSAKFLNVDLPWRVVPLWKVIPYGLLLLSVFLILGNAHSIFLQFRGGKCVATTLGILSFLFPYLALGVVVVWVILLLIFKRVDIASLGSFLSSIPIYFLLPYSRDTLTILFLIFMVAYIFVRHKKNIISMR